jgi:hypothetical protein
LKLTPFSSFAVGREGHPKKIQGFRALSDELSTDVVPPLVQWAPLWRLSGVVSGGVYADYCVVMSLRTLYRVAQG